MRAYFITSALLLCSNVFMVLAWYGFLGKYKHLPWIGMVLLCWGVAFFEYLFMVPANQLGHANGLSFPQLRMLQEIISLVVFALFVWLARGQPWRWDHLWAAFCLLGAVYFIFRGEKAAAH
jgi:hypothetical protein